MASRVADQGDERRWKGGAQTRKRELTLELFQVGEILERAERGHDDAEGLEKERLSRDTDATNQLQGDIGGQRETRNLGEDVFTLRWKRCFD